MKKYFKVDDHTKPNGSVKKLNIIHKSATDFKYFDIGKRWSKTIKPIFESDEIQTQLFRDFTKYVKMKNRNLNCNYRNRCSSQRANMSYSPGDYPISTDSSDWRFSRRGRPPVFDQYVCHAACHWIVNSLLRTAATAYPKRPWVIVSSDDHSTVWDQDETFFDMNFLALGVTPKECAELTVFNPASYFLERGQLLHIY